MGHYCRREGGRGRSSEGLAEVVASAGRGNTNGTPTKGGGGWWAGLCEKAVATNSGSRGTWKDNSAGVRIFLGGSSIRAAKGGELEIPAKASTLCHFPTSVSPNIRYLQLSPHFRSSFYVLQILLFVNFSSSAW